MSEAQDKTFFRNFSVVVAAIAVMMVLFYVAARFAGHVGEDPALRVDSIARLTAPVGRLNVAGEEAAVAAEAAGQAPAPASAAPAAAQVALAPADKGKRLYPVCAACHGGKGEGGIGPALAGQTSDAIASKLAAYKAGETIGAQSALMWGQAAGLSEEDIANLAAYISTGFE